MPCGSKKYRTCNKCRKLIDPGDMGTTWCDQCAEDERCEYMPTRSEIKRMCDMLKEERLKFMARIIGSDLVTPAYSPRIHKDPMHHRRGGVRGQ